MADPPRLPPPPSGAYGQFAPGAPQRPQLPPLPPGAVLVDQDGNEQKQQPSALPPLPPGAVLVDQDGKELPPPEKERGVNLDLLGETLENAPGSLVKNIGQTVEGLKTAVTDPIGTATNLGKLALTSTYKLNPFAQITSALYDKLGDQLPPQMKQNLDALIENMDAPRKAIVKDYVDAYGGGQNILKTIATDPFRVLTDLATIASGGQMAAATMPGKLGTVTRAVSKAAQLGDPLSLAMKGTELSGKGVLRALDATTGVGQGVMQDALKFGFQGGEAGDLFRRGLKEVDPSEVARIAREGLDTWKQRVSADFQADKAIWDKSNAKLDFTPMRRAQMQVEDSMYSRTGQTQKLVISEGDKAKIEKAMAVIEQWRADPTAHTVLGMDDLKKAIRNQIDWKSDSSVVTSALTKLSNQAKDIALKAADPKYRTSLKNYSDAMEQMEDVEKALGLGNKTALHTTLTKLQKTVRNNANTQYGLQKDLAKQLETEGGKSFMPMLSGQALSSWAPRGITRGTAAGTLPGMGGLGMFFDPLMGAGVAAGTALTMPRLMGSTVHNIGRLAGTSRYIPQTVKGTFGKFMSQPMRNAYANYDRMANEEPFGGFARGGKAGRAYRPQRFAQGGMPEESAVAALKGPYSEIGLGSIAQAAKRRIGAVAPPKPPPVAIPEAPKVQFAKAAPDPLTGLLKQVGDAIRPQEDQGGDLQARIAEALAGVQAKGTGAGSTTDAEAKATSSGTYKPTGDADLDRYLQANAGFESGHDTQATNKGSGARGLYQFLPSTWASLIKAKPELGLTMENLYEADPQKAKEYQTKAMHAFTADNAAHFKAKFGRAPTGGELYAMHLLGAGGGTQLVAGADQEIAKIVAASALAGNPFLQKFQTGRDALNWMNKRFG